MKKMIGTFVLLNLTLLSATLCHAENAVLELVSRLEPELWRRAEAVRHLGVPLAHSQFQKVVEGMVRQRVPVHAESEECRAHSQLVADAVSRGETWALRMFDASTKIPSRVLEGNLLDRGHYHECVGTRGPNDMFTGQHCLVETRGIIPPELHKSVNLDYSQAPPELTIDRWLLPHDLTLAVCVPSTCSARDVQVHMDRVLAPINASSRVYDSSCSTAQPLPLRPMDYVAISVFLGIIAIVLWSSYMDRRSSGPKADVVEAFSLTRNWRQLVDVRVGGPEDISCLHGLRVLSTSGIVFAHQLAAITVSFNVPINTRLQTDSLLVLMSENLLRGVDVFFMIGGTVRAYGFFRDRYKGRPLDVMSSIARRYLRYTPTLAVVMLYTATLLIHSSKGPLWGRAMDYYTWCCRKNWILNVFQIQNYIYPLASCTAESWYLAVDFQMFVFSTLILIPLYFRPKLGMTLLISTLLGSLACFARTAYIQGVAATSFTFLYYRLHDEMTSELYFYTHLRAPPYLLGLALGYLLFNSAQTKKPIKLSKAALWTGWILSLSTWVLLFAGAKVILTPDYEYTPWLDTLFMVCNKPLVAASVAWVVLVCTQGYGGIVNDFLSWRGFQPLSKLTLGVYLVNFGLICVPKYARQTYPVDVDLVTLLHNWLGDLAWATVIAVPLYLCVELPCCTLAYRYLVTPVPKDPLLAHVTASTAKGAKEKSSTWKPFQPETQCPLIETKISSTRKVKKKNK